jgi:hypothetical protein
MVHHSALLFSLSDARRSVRTTVDLACATKPIGDSLQAPVSGSNNDDFRRHGARRGVLNLPIRQMIALTASDSAEPPNRLFRLIYGHRIFLQDIDLYEVLISLARGLPSAATAPARDQPKSSITGIRNTARIGAE